MNPSNEPSVSLIIPMRNEEKFAARCLDSLLEQLGDYAGEWEILCLDGASVDATKEILQSYASRDSRIIVIDNPKRIVPVAMNLALAQAKGEVIIRLDAHSEYDPKYIRACLEGLERTGADVVGGFCNTVPGVDSPTGRAIAAATSNRFGVGGAVYRVEGTGDKEVDTVPFGCFRREVFARFGGYDERLVRNQDIDLALRIRRGGGRICICSDIQMTYFNRSTYQGIRQQSFYNGLWNPYTVYLIGHGLRLRHFIPLFFVASILTLGIAGLLWWPIWILLAVELLMYSAVGGRESLRMAKEHRTTPGRIFWAFLNLHLPYGCGSLWGVLTAIPKFGLSRKKGHVGVAIPQSKE